MKFAVLQEQNAENFPSNISLLNASEKQGHIKYLGYSDGWLHKENGCLGTLAANGKPGHFDCRKCGSSFRKKLMSSSQLRPRQDNAKSLKVKRENGLLHRFIVGSQTKEKAYLVYKDSHGNWTCPCDDFHFHRMYLDWHCKHIIACQSFLEQETSSDSGKSNPPAVSRIQRVEKQSGTTIISVDSASPNGHGEYACQLTGHRHSDGGITHISTTLGGEDLQRLGYQLPVCASQYAYLRLDSAETEAEDETGDEELDARAQAIHRGYQQQPFSTFYSCLSRIDRQLTGIDASMIKAYIAKQEGFTSVEQLPENRVAHWGARLQCAVGHETLRAKLEKEIRSSLSKNKCVECSAGIDFGKRRCRKCTDGMLSNLLEKKGYHRTDGTGTTNASIRVPTAV